MREPKFNTQGCVYRWADGLMDGQQDCNQYIVKTARLHCQYKCIKSPGQILYCVSQWLKCECIKVLKNTFLILFFFECTMFPFNNFNCQTAKARNTVTTIHLQTSRASICYKNEIMCLIQMVLNTQSVGSSQITFFLSYNRIMQYTV